MKHPKHTWNSTPYDYTQPSACRLLMSDYPYRYYQKKNKKTYFRNECCVLHIHLAI